MEADGGRGDNQFFIMQQDYGQQVSTPFSRRRQIIATVCATLGCLLNGAVIGYTGPALPSLADPGGGSFWGPPLLLQDQEASWITSLLSIGCFVGCVMAGPLMERIGRKKSLMLVAMGNYAVGFTCILLADRAEFIYVGRFLNGMGLGFVLATVSVYIVEIATNDMRGLLGCFVQFQGSVGVLLTFSLGALLNWWQISLGLLVLVLPIILAMWFIPESPRWLIMRGNEWEGEVALKWLRGRGPQQLDREIDQIKREIAIRKRERISITLLLDPEVIKPFAICMMMMFFLQMSGFNVMVFYCVTIFQKSGSVVHPSLASIIVGCVLVLSCFVALGVVSRLNRKVMLVGSILGMAACHATLGASFYFIEALEAERLVNCSNCTQSVLTAGEYVAENPVGWLPPLAIIGFLFLGNVGYGTLIWVVTAELLPPKVRSIANSFIICFAFITGFLVAKTFVDLVQAIGCSGTFWFYGAVCAAGALFTLIFVPETRDKTIEEIQDHFRPRGRGGRQHQQRTLPVREQPMQNLSTVS